MNKEDWIQFQLSQVRSTWSKKSNFFCHFALTFLSHLTTARPCKQFSRYGDPGDGSTTVNSKEIKKSKSQYWARGAKEHVDAAESEKARRTDVPTDGRTNPIIEVVLRPSRANTSHADGRTDRRSGPRKEVLSSPEAIHGQRFPCPAYRYGS